MDSMMDSMMDGPTSACSYYRDCMVCVDETVAHFSRTGPGYRAPGTPLIGMHVRAEFEGDNPPYVDGVIIEVNAEGTKLAINYFDGDTGVRAPPAFPRFSSQQQ